MPELPEVETVRRTLLPTIGKRIGSVWDSGQGLHMGRRPPRAQLQALTGATLRAIRRRGKYLLLDLFASSRSNASAKRSNSAASNAAGGSKTLLVHLGMTGRLLIVPAGTPRAKHTHLVMQLGDRSELRFVDARRFGFLDVIGIDGQHAALASLGPDPLVDGIQAQRVYEVSRDKRATLKAFLLDQRVIAGLGNIYVSEALWRAKLRPTTLASQLTAAKARSLASAIGEVIGNALDKGGTSLRDFVNAEGAKGENADYLWVYGRHGQPCFRCQTKIQRQVLHGRATYFCPTCQP